MQATEADGNNQSMDVNSGYNTQTVDQPESQESTSSDQEDKTISNNENFHRVIRESSSIAEIEKALSNKLININYQNKQGDTALNVAVRLKNRLIVDLLIKHGADVTVENNHKKKKTPLVLVKERLDKDPNNIDLKLIQKSLLHAKPGPSQPKRQHEPNDSDEDVPDSKRPKMDSGQCNSTKTVETFGPSGLRLNAHGTVYQTKLLALFVKRALAENYEFELTTEWEEAEKFDDIVFKYKSNSETDEWIWRFVQAKHKQNIEKKKISNNDLTSMSDDNDFSLQKYFISFCRVKSKKRFKEANFEDFSIITNTEFEFIQRKQSVADQVEQPKCTRNASKSNQKCFFVEETSLDQDPILHIDGKKFKPRKFKFSQEETAKADLFELFHLSLFGCALKSKEIENLPLCKKKLETLKKIPENELNEKKVIQASDLLTEIERECLGKKAKTNILKMAKKLKENLEKFLIENDYNKLVDDLNEVIGKSNKESAEIFQKEKHYEEMRLKANAIVKTAKGIINVFQSTLNEYNDLESVKFFGLENEKKKLYNDEHKLQTIQKEISDSNDIDWVKEKMKTESILIEKDVIPKSAMIDLNKENDLNELQKKLDKRIGKIITEISAIIVVLNDDAFKTEFDQFFQQFRFITNYPNEANLSDILEDELGEDFKLLNASLVSHSFEREMINFLKEYHCRFYSGENGRDFLKELKIKVSSLMCVGLCKSYTERLENFNIRFQEDFADLNDFLLNQRRFEDTQVFQLSTPLTTLCAIQVYRHLSDCGLFTARDSYIFIRLRKILYRTRHDELSTRQFILNAFQSIVQNVNKIYNLCVIECGPDCRKLNIDKEHEREDEDELSEELLNILLNDDNKSKKIILIASDKDTFADGFRVKLKRKFKDRKIFEKIENEVKFGDLDVDSQDRVLAKRINFQGNDQIRFNQLIDDKVLANDIIDPENLLKLIMIMNRKKDIIQIGDEKVFSSIGFVEDYYIDREFNIQEICDDNSINISEKKLMEIERKVTLLANDSGMGKSTTLTSVARKIKEKSENTWIFRIDLNDYASTINTIKFNRYDSVKCIDFLSRIVIRGKKIDANVRLQRKLFTACLTNNNNELKKPPIIFLFDGFDEISPTYNEKSFRMLVSLMDTNIRQLWITTRPHEKEDLKRELNSDIYYLQPLQPGEQKKFLDKFLHWHLNSMTVGIKKKIRDRKFFEIRKCLENIESTSLKLGDTQLSSTITDTLSEYPKRNSKKSNKLYELKTEIEKLSFDEYIQKMLSLSAEDKHFHGNPLNLKILVQVICGENQLLEKFELFYLYKTFANMQFNIFYKYKAKMKFYNVAAEGQRKRDEQYLNDMHNALAVKVFLPKIYKKKLLPNLEKFKTFEIKRDASEEKDLLRVGLLTIRRDRPEFTHHSYAEFFFSKYLMMNFTVDCVQKIFFRNILFERKYNVIRRFFNDQLKELESAVELKSASKTLLHRIVQKKSGKNIFTILEEESCNEILKLIDFSRHNTSTEE